MRLSPIILVSIFGSLVVNTAVTSSSTCCCYVKADGTENCNEPYTTPSVSTIRIGYPKGLGMGPRISATLCCEDPNHQIINSNWCDGSAGKEEEIELISQIYNDNFNNDTAESLSEVLAEADATTTDTTNTTNTMCTGEFGYPNPTPKYSITTPTICNKESGLCASCEVGLGKCSCTRTCADGSTTTENDMVGGCSTSEPSYEYGDCNNEDPGLCTTTTSTSGRYADHKLTADGVDYYFVTSKLCAGTSAGTMSSSNSFIMMLLASVTATIWVIGILK